ncbi:MAG: acyl-CoA dehydrogenase, partial [Gammaproteobacteria bacterium]
ANILTRTMMIFGQGAVRCHPYIQKEMHALAETDDSKALHEFDAVLWQHIGFFLSNLVRGFWFGLSNARFSTVPGDKTTRRYYQQLTRLSTSFTLSADFALLTLGGNLKRKERISGRFADVLSHLYLCSCVLKHFENQGSQEEDIPLVHWACQHSIYQAQQSLLAVYRLLPLQIPALLLRTVLFPLGKPYSPPQDRLVGQLAQILLNDSSCRDRLTTGIYINDNPEDATGRIEVAFKAVILAAPIEAKLQAAQKLGKLDKGPLVSTINSALAQNIISQADADTFEAAEQARANAIMVNDFEADELTGQL